MNQDTQTKFKYSTNMDTSTYNILIINVFQIIHDHFIYLYSDHYTLWARPAVVWLKNDDQFIDIQLENRKLTLTIDYALHIQS